VGLCVSRFNRHLTEPLLRSAVDCLRERDVSLPESRVVWVPGAYEIPTALQVMAESRRFHALVALGAIIWGETAHAALIARQVTQALSEISRRFRIPVIDGVVTAYSEEQARIRCCTGRQSRGWYAAAAAVEMANLMARMQQELLD